MTLPRLAEKLLFPLSLTSAGCIVLLMVVSFADVLLRKMNTPIPGAYEITEIGVGAMVFAALPLVSLRQEHIRVSLFGTLAARHRWVRVLFSVTGRVIATLVLGFLAWHLARLGNQMHATGARAIFAGFPLAPFAWFAAAMSGLSILAALVAPFEPAKPDSQGEI
jgi:TRAP-type C4-dicarboxylate transport system permease small subunit